MTEVEAPYTSGENSPRSAGRVVPSKVRRARRVPEGGPSRRRRDWLVLPAALLGILSLVGWRYLGRAGGGTVDTVDGLPVQSVSEVLAGRAEMTVGGGPVAVRGYWSVGVVRLTCAADISAAELEIPCYDGQYGLTELEEPIFSSDRVGDATAASGPHLTPWIPDGLARGDELFSLPIINGQRYLPVPIVVVGHFDDPRSKECAAAAMKTCQDRLVIDRIAVFDPRSVATPAPSPSPTPFPSPAPKGLFDPKTPRVCAGDVPYSFVGWTTTDALKLPVKRDGQIWAAVTAEAVLLGGDEWTTEDNTVFRWWGKMICFAEDGEPAVIEYGAVEGTTYKEWQDGTTTKADLP
jgi:hypothetical protein